MKIRLRSFILCSTLSVLLPAAALAEFTIYSPKDGLADGWKTVAWNGPVTEEIEGPAKGTTVLQVGLKSGAQAYAGVILTAAAGSGVPLTGKLRESGVVRITFKLGQDVNGIKSTVSQPLQLALSFLTKDGETVHGKFNTQVTVTPASATAPDGQVEAILLPVSLEGIKAPETLASISALRFQYSGEPLSGFAIVDCSVKTE
ncbi:MAG: hypothetical protein K0R17_3199 [Rariglobus sp.]|jgi:hypothetical protein|nr:hypothetical protein [Rariglobus sp.]